MHQNITRLVPLFFFLSVPFSYAQFNKQILLEVDEADASVAAQYSLITTLDADQDNDQDVVGELSPEETFSPIYINFNNSIEDDVPGWNNLRREPKAGSSISLTNAAGESTGALLTLDTEWNGAGNQGYNSEQKDGVYPNGITRSYYFTSGTEQITISGLDPSAQYDFTFYASSSYPDDRTTLYRIGSQEVVLDASFNTVQTVSIEGAQPNEEGKIIIQTGNTPTTKNYSFLGAIVIELSSQEPHKYVLLSNNGQSPFAEGQTVDGAANWAFAKTVDINKDSYPDLLAYDTEDQEILWYENQAGKSFKKNVVAGSVASSISAADIITADLNQDGALDIIVREGQQLFWYEQSGGSFLAKALWAESGSGKSTNTASLIQGDIDGDNLPDIIWQSGEGIYVLTSSSSYSAENSISVAGVSSPIVLTTTDMTGDGQADLVITEGYSWTGNYRIGYLTNNDGTIGTSPSFLTIGDFNWLNQRPESLLANDIDQDGDLDFYVNISPEACSSVDSPKAGWIENQGNWQSAQYHSINSQRQAQWVDIDQDGDQDLIGGQANSPGIYWKENLDQRWGSTAYNAIDQPVVDQIRQVVTPANTEEPITNYTIRSTAHIVQLDIQQGTVLPPTIREKVNSSAAAIALSDTDTDGIPELVIADVNTEGFAVVRWQNSATGLHQSLITHRGALSNQPIFLADNKFLFAPIDEAGDQYGWWQWESGSFVRKGAIEGTVTQVADVNADGNVDVVTESGWYQNVENSRFRAMNDAQGTHVVDFDGDGDLDIMDAAATNGVTWYQNSNGGFSATNLNIPVEDAIDFADLDADGDADIISATTTGIFWRENTDGKGTLGTATSIDELRATSLQVIDADADGDMDIIAFNGQTLALYNNAYQKQENTAPEVQTNIEDQTATADTLFQFELPINAFVDKDAGDILMYSISGKDGTDLPAWLAFNQNDRTLSGTPAVSDTGVVVLQARATDSSGASASQDFNLTVQKAEGSGEPGDGGGDPGDGGSEPGDGGGEPGEGEPDPPIVTSVGDEVSSDVILFPNPVYRGEPILIKNLPLRDITEGYLYSAQGKALKVRIDRGSSSLGSSSLTPGVYLLELHTAQQVYRKKIVVR